MENFARHVGPKAASRLKAVFSPRTLCEDRLEMSELVAQRVNTQTSSRGVFGKDVHAEIACHEQAGLLKVLDRKIRVSQQISREAIGMTFRICRLCIDGG